MDNQVEKQKIQIQWGTLIVEKFLLLVSKNNLLPQEKVEEIRNDISQLREGEKQSDWKEDEGKLNQIVSKINQELKLTMDPALYAPFPKFSTVREENERSALLDQMDMVERMLTQASESKVIDWAQEGSYFNAILHLFEEVEQGHLNRWEVMARLNNEIQTINGSLADEFKFPLVNLSAYE